ncbi:hypothetical protein LCI18_007939 [Fusarium solani-melongenae]|uniref:Uncharacterized protein n=1 Tax=Fusarium solani subsp. cucurbitae TaxID=2747967 RepID=A0ACD3Z6W9_FUSSC|nr:hypothetical protein LCI18_007939 [Fusarium solani-melongenae]
MPMDQQDEDMLQRMQLLRAGYNLDCTPMQTHFPVTQFDSNISEMPSPATYGWPHPPAPLSMSDLGIASTAPIIQDGHCPGGNEWTLYDIFKTEALDMPGLDNTPPSHTITPCTERLKPVTPTQYPISLTAVPGTKLDTDRPPKRHRLQAPQITDGPDGHLVSLLDQSTFNYQGHIHSLTHAHNLRQQYDLLSCQRDRNTTSPEQDQSFPSTDDEFRDRIREIFEAICDWTDLREWRAKMGQKRVREWLAEVSQQRRSLGLDDDLSKLSDKELQPPANRMPSMKEQWKNVIHRTMSDVEIELLCAQILDNKVLIHSAIRAPWITRITNSPHSETRRKYQNKAGNDRKRTLIEQGGSEKKKAKAESMSPF